MKKQLSDWDKIRDCKNIVNIVLNFPKVLDGFGKMGYNGITE